jgi:hypothetical protein
MSGDNLETGPTINGIKSLVGCIGIIPNLKNPAERSALSKRRERP